MTQLAAAILLWGILVLVPLGIHRLVCSIRGVPRLLDGRPFSPVLSLAGLSAAVAFLFPQGSWSAALFVTPWMLVTWFLALTGMRWYRTSRGHTHDQWCALVGLLFISIGGTFTMLSRCGYKPLEFSDQIVLLTAVHFHYAGFVLPVIAALILCRTNSPFNACIMVAIVVGIPLVAVGISFLPLVEVVAAVGLGMGGSMLAGLQLFMALTSSHPMRLTLLGISSVSLLTAMVLAIIYAIGEFVEIKWIEIAVMIPTHGLANAIGFSFCGLLGHGLPAERKR